MQNNSENYTDFSLNLLFRLIRTYLKLILVIIIAALIIVLIWSFIMPQKYEATATVLPPQQKESTGNLSSFLQSFAGGGGGLILGGLGQSNQTAVFGEILKSRSIAEYITNKFNLKNHPLFEGMSENDIYELLKSSSDIEIERSGLIKVSFTVSTHYFASGSQLDSAAKLSANFANSAIEGLDFIIRQKTMSTAKKTRLYIEGELSKYKSKLDSIEYVLESFQSENKVLAIDEQTKALMNQAISIGSELTKAEIDLNLARFEFEPNSPKVKALEKSVAFLSQQYEKIQKGGLVSSDKFSIPLQNLPNLIRQYTSLVREQKILEQVILYLETQRHQEAIQEERDLPVVEILDKATIPETREAPNRKLMLLLAFIISAFFAVGFVITRAYFKGKLIKSE